MKTKFSNLITLTLIIIFSGLNAQNSDYGSASGVILDTSKIPLPGAEIYLQLGNRFIGAASNIDGKFVLTNIPVGEHTLSINYLGYKEYTLQLHIASHTTLVIPEVILEPSSETLDDVLIKAKSKGQVRALNIQKNSENIINVISLEQASKFPDSNIGDALKRVSGVTIKQDQGEAREVSIRGLGTESTTMLINGDRIASTSFNSRNVDADLIPADVIQSIEVFKSASADLDGEATGGVINLITRAAYSSDLKLSVIQNFALTPTWNKLNHNTAIGISKKLFSNKLGIALNGSINSRFYKSDNIEADWDWSDSGVLGDPTDDTRFFNELQIRQYWIRRDRKNINLGLDYEISKKSLIGIKSSLSYRDDFENRYRTRYSSIDIPQFFTKEGIIVSEGNITTYSQGGSSNGKPNNFRLDSRNLFNTKLYGKHILGALETNWSLSHSTSKKRNDRRQLSYRISEGNATLFVDIRDPNRPKVSSDISDFSEEATFYQFTRTLQNIDDTSIKGKLSLKYPFKNGYFKAGGQYRKNTHEEDNRLFEILSLDGTIEDFQTIPSTNYKRSNFNFDQYSMLPSPDRAFVGSLKIDNPQLFSINESLETRTSQNFESTEMIAASYIQAKYYFNRKFSIRSGVRIERTQGDYNAYILDPISAEVSPNLLKVTYDNILPSADLKYEFKRWLIARLAYSKTINRPSYSRIVPRIRVGNSDLNDDREIGRITIGNPDLRPRISNNYDFSIEYYMPKAGLISLGLFYKDLSDFYSRINENITLVNGDILQIRKTQNIGDASIKGIEFVLQRQLDFLPWYFKNLNFYGNITVIDAGLVITNPDFSGFNSQNFRKNRSLTDTSDLTYNTSLSYKGKQLEITGSLNGTSAFIDSYGPTPIQDEYYDQQVFLDFNASFDLSEKLKLYLEAKNLTNQPLRYYIGTSKYLTQEEYYGSQYVIGLKYIL